MLVYNIVRKRKVLETNLKSEKIMNFYPIFFIYLSTFIVISFRTSMFFFANLTSGWWTYSIGDKLERNFFFRYPGIGTVLHWRDTGLKNLLLTLP